MGASLGQAIGGNALCSGRRASASRCYSDLASCHWLLWTNHRGGWDSRVELQLEGGEEDARRVWWLEGSGGANLKVRYPTVLLVVLVLL